jgi:HD superfamily phosphohydrolase YqeK
MGFFRRLREDYVDKPVKIVLDNARYQHCEAVIKTALSWLFHYSVNIAIGRYRENPLNELLS